VVNILSIDGVSTGSGVPGVDILWFQASLEVLSSTLLLGCSSLSCECPWSSCRDSHCSGVPDVGFTVVASFPIVVNIPAVPSASQLLSWTQEQWNTQEFLDYWAEIVRIRQRDKSYLYFKFRGSLVHVDPLIDFYKHKVILFHRHTYKVTLQPSTRRKLRLIESKAKCVII
jgi:hypothetical protein